MDNAQALIDTATTPDRRELRRRHNVLIQFIHFMNLNWNMYTLAKRHH